MNQMEVNGFQRALHARNWNGQCLDIMPLSRQDIGHTACLSPRGNCCPCQHRQAVWLQEAAWGTGGEPRPGVTQPMTGGYEPDKKTFGNSTVFICEMGINIMSFINWMMYCILKSIDNSVWIYWLMMLILEVFFPVQEDCVTPSCPLWLALNLPLFHTCHVFSQRLPHLWWIMGFSSPIFITVNTVHDVNSN